MQRSDCLYPPDIQVMDRLRSNLSENSVLSLMDSISRIGLKMPISIRWVPDDDDVRIPVLVAGRHRLEAVKRLGLQSVDVLVHEDEHEARLWEIAENLHRAELSVQERADHIAEWIRITEEQSAQVEPIGRVGHRPKSGLNDAVRNLGIERNEAQRSVKIASIDPEAKQAAVDAGIKTQSGLLEVAKEPTLEKQKSKVQEIKRRAEDRKLMQSAGDDIVKRDGADDAAQMLLDFVPEFRVPEMLGYLDSCGCSRLTAAVRRAIKTGGRVGSDKAVFDSTRFGSA